MGKRVIASYCTTFLQPEMLHIYRQITALRGVDTFVVAKWIQNADRFPFRDMELLRPPRMNLLRHGWLKHIKHEPPIVYRGEYQAMASLLERRGADMMHIYFGHTGVHLLPFIEQWTKPCIVSFHGADVSLKEDIVDYKAKLRRLFGLVPLVLARSHSLADRLIKIGCPPEKLRINRTGIPLRDFPYIRREPPKSIIRIVQACRLIPKKGIKTTLRAFAAFHARNPHSELIFAGKGPLQHELETLATHLGIRRNIHFYGFLTQENLNDLYSSAHLFVHPSEMQSDEDQEGIPNSLLEAMATGLPVFATRHGGIPEAVEHGRTGILVEERDHIGLARAMDEMIHSPEMMRAMGQDASESVALNFEQRRQISQLESFYQEAITMAAAEEPIVEADLLPAVPRAAERATEHAAAG